jgi:hypothetical protein
MKCTIAGKIQMQFQGKFRMLRSEHRVTLPGGSEMADVPDHADFSSRLVAAFEKHVQLPLMGHAGQMPGEVSTLIATIRDRLDALETLVPGQASSSSSGLRVNGANHAESSAAPYGTTSLDNDDIGRNQRSRVRELALLATLEAEHNALSLVQITRSLKDAGFEDTSAAIVSQLHRLKKLGVIAQPANGMYALTQTGVLHARELRKHFGHLVRR